MSRIHQSFLTLAAAALALGVAACSETTAPTSSLRAGDASLIVGTTANVGTVQQTIASSGTTQFCSSATALRSYTIPGTFAPVVGCGTAVDLQAALAVYNPGWTNNLTASSWIGPVLASGTSNEYKAVPGTYVFQSTFTPSPGATSIVLNDTLRSDNAIAVYLNGFQLGTQVIADCTDATGVNCNWTGNLYVVSDASSINPTHFVAGTNTITVLLVDTPNGGNAGNGFSCTKPFQPNGELGFSHVFNVPTSPSHIVANWQQNAATGCENPTGLDFHGGISWVPAPVTTWCSPGFWKNNGRDLWSQYYTKRYSTLAGAAPLGKKAPAGYDPTLLEVIDNPSIYGGEATNSVADFLSNKAFGTPIGSGVESCPDNVPTLTLPR